jgi:hypothetical protein
MTAVRNCEVVWDGRQVLLEEMSSVETFLTTTKRFLLQSTVNIVFHDSNIESATLYSDLFRKVLRFSGSYGSKSWRGRRDSGDVGRRC